MDTDKVARGRGPESTPYDKMRHESMKLRAFSPTYGVEKVFLKDMPIFPGTCTKCVFNEGGHTCGR